MASAKVLPHYQVARLAGHRLGDRQADPALRRAAGIAHFGGDIGGGNAARGVIYGAVLGAACWAALLLML